jgi:hypothetical protein
MRGEKATNGAKYHFMTPTVKMCHPPFSGTPDRAEKGSVRIAVLLIDTAGGMGHSGGTARKLRLQYAGSGLSFIA